MGSYVSEDSTNNQNPIEAFHTKHALVEHYVD